MQHRGPVGTEPCTQPGQLLGRNDPPSLLLDRGQLDVAARGADQAVIVNGGREDGAHHVVLAAHGARRCGLGPRVDEVLDVPRGDGRQVCVSRARAEGGCAAPTRREPGSIVASTGHAPATSPPIRETSETSGGGRPSRLDCDRRAHGPGRSPPPYGCEMSACRGDRREHEGGRRTPRHASSGGGRCSRFSESWRIPAWASGSARTPSAHPPRLAGWHRCERTAAFRSSGARRAWSGRCLGVLTGQVVPEAVGEGGLWCVPSE